MFISMDSLRKMKMSLAYYRFDEKQHYSTLKSTCHRLNDYLYGSH